MLRREGLPVNAERVRRLMHELAICGWDRSRIRQRFRSYEGQRPDVFFNAH
jgi:hypothetical protein